MDRIHIASTQQELTQPLAADSPARPSEVARPPRSLRQRLFILGVSGLVPLAVMAALALAYFIEERQEVAKRSALELSRALGSTVDSELRSAADVLETLALSEDLASGDLQSFYRAALRATERQRWRSILLTDGATGRPLFRTSAPFGAPERVPVDPESLALAMRNRRTVIGKVTPLPPPSGAFAVRVPALGGAQPEYILTAVVPTDKISAVLKRQSVPPSWVISVIDQVGQRVARTRDNPSNSISPSMQKLMDGGLPEGSGVTYTLEGIQSFTGYTRLRDSGWMVGVGIPVAEIRAAIYAPIAAVLTGLLASLLLTAYLVRYLARKVTGPIDLLKKAAGALGRGEKVERTPLGIAELDVVDESLVQAAIERDRYMHALRMAQNEREALLERASAGLRSAEEAGRVKDEFLAVLGHELRNPLAPIAMALQLMDRKGDPVTAKERAVVRRQLRHMTRLVDDLLDVSRITGRRLTMEMAPLLLAPLLEQAVDAIRPTLGERRISLDIERQAHGVWVLGDEARLAQVFSNLLGNALKFTQDHGCIAVIMRAVADGVQIEVCDDGVGMRPEVLTRAFDPFFQERQGTERARGGLGLGLAIVRSLVEMHGGRVQARSDGEGHGSCLAVTLPECAPVEKSQPQMASFPTGGHGRILIVDDNVDAADSAAALLETPGYEVRAAYDPQTALALLDEFEPDVAVLDIGLPGMSGYDLARRLRAHPKGRHCGLIALSGYAREEDVALARAAGFDLHLAKPAGPDELLSHVERLLRARAD